MGLADIDGFIYDGCATIEQSHGIDDTNPTRGTIDQDRFELYVKEKVVPFVGRYDKCEPRSILIIDNATIHQGIRDIIEHPDVGEKVIFTAPYRYVRFKTKLLFLLFLLFPVLSCSRCPALITIC